MSPFAGVGSAPAGTAAPSEIMPPLQLAQPTGAESQQPVATGAEPQHEETGAESQHDETGAAPQQPEA